MKIKLKDLFWLVTIAAFICFMVVYALDRYRLSKRRIEIEKAGAMEFDEALRAASPPSATFEQDGKATPSEFNQSFSSVNPVGSRDGATIPSK